jgi:hypothetical protein
MKCPRRDPPRRITPERMAYYKARAKQLRNEAFRDVARKLWASLRRAIGVGNRRMGRAKRNPSYK